MNSKEKSMIISLLGATGNMGQEVVYELLKLDFIDTLRLLVLKDDPRIKELIKRNKKKIE